MSHILAINLLSVVGTSPVGAAPTTSSFPTYHMASMDWAKTTARRNEKHLTFKFLDLVRFTLDDLRYVYRNAWSNGQYAVFIPDDML